MATSLLITAPGTITDTNLPLAYADSIINHGSLFLYDFLRSGSWDPAVDVVANNAAVRNLVPGAPSARLKIPNSGDLIFQSGVGGGFKLKTSVALGRVQLGGDAGTDYFQADLAHDFLLICWVTYPAADPGGHVGFLLTKGTSAGYGGPGPQLARRWDSGGDMYGKMSAATSAGTGTTGLGAPNGRHQLAIAKVGSNTVLFKDGAQVYSAATGSPALAANSTPLNFGNGGAAGQYAAPGTILHRVYGEDLTLSAATAAGQVAADWATNAARFG